LTSAQFRIEFECGWSCPACLRISAVSALSPIPVPTSSSFLWSPSRRNHVDDNLPFYNTELNNASDNFFLSSLNTTKNCLLDNDTDSSYVVENFIFGKGLILAHCNINGIKSKFEEVVLLLNNHNLFFLGISETRLETVDTFFPLSIIGYNYVRIDRVRSGGGLLFYIRDSVNFEVIPITIKFPRDSEVCLIKVKATGVKSFFIILIYNNPKDSKSDFLLSISCLLSYIQPFQSEYILLGDFNIDLVTPDAESSKIFSLRREFCLKQLVASPTRRAITKRGVTSKLLDHIYVTNPEAFPTTGQFSFAGSDHDLVFAVRKVNKVKAPPKRVTFRAFRNIDRDKFFSSLKLLDLSYLSINNTSSNFLFFRSQILLIIESFAPMKTKIIRGVRQPWFIGKIFFPT
jgi:exonuclease III